MILNLSLKNNEHKELKLVGVSESEKDVLYWFINNKYIGKSLAHKPLYWQMRAGHFEVMILGSKDRSASNNFAIELIE